MLKFIISDTQHEKLKEWQKDHDCPLYDAELGCRYVGAAGGADTYIFNPTGLGEIVKVRCSCGAEIDLTEDF